MRGRAQHPFEDVAWHVAIQESPLAVPVRHHCENVACALTGAPIHATVRPEWSKGWAYTTRGAWTNRRFLERTLPRAFRVGRPPDQTWDAAVRTLERLDPHAVFTSPLLRSLLRARSR